MNDTNDESDMTLGHIMRAIIRGPRTTETQEVSERQWGRSDSARGSTPRSSDSQSDSSYSRDGTPDRVPPRPVSDPAVDEFELDVPKDQPDLDLPLHMPSPPEEAAWDIGRMSVEGEPGDASSGPSMLILELLGIVAVLLIGAGVLGTWFGWPAGIFVMGWAAVALAVNPVFWATLFRVGERRAATRIERRRINSSCDYVPDRPSVPESSGESPATPHPSGKEHP